MKKVFLLLVLLIGTFSFYALAEARTTRVRGYYKPSTGSYVVPHYRTSPNSYRYDNWSTRGNHNPYTGKKGYMSPFGW